MSYHGEEIYLSISIYLLSSHRLLYLCSFMKVLSLNSSIIFPLLHLPSSSFSSIPFSPFPFLLSPFMKISSNLFSSLPFPLLSSPPLFMYFSLNLRFFFLRILLFSLLLMLPPLFTSLDFLLFLFYPLFCDDMSVMNLHDSKGFELILTGL